MLGAALAREAGTDYPGLVRERVFEPLGMDGTGVLGADFEGAPAGAALPHKEPGARVELWESLDYAPAGVGTWTTLSDLERFARAVGDGSAPGMSALEPRAESALGDAAKQGLGWVELTAENGTVLHAHDGGTYGTTAFLAVDRDSGRAVAAFTNTGLASLPAVFGQQVLAGEDVMGAAALEEMAPPALALGMTLPMVLLPVLLAAAFAVRRRTLVGQRPIDRMRIVSMPLGAAAVLALALPLGSWAVTPPVLWAAGLGAVAASAIAAAAQWNRTVWNNARWPWLHYPFFALSVLVSLSLIGVAGWAVSTPCDPGAGVPRRPPGQGRGRPGGDGPLRAGPHGPASGVLSAPGPPRAAPARRRRIRRGGAARRRRCRPPARRPRSGRPPGTAARARPGRRPGSPTSRPAAGRPSPPRCPCPSRAARR
ncbi:serine hydrolase domain-containing protein [Nocardiopsis composta]